MSEKLSALVINEPTNADPKKTGALPVSDKKIQKFKKKKLLTINLILKSAKNVPK
tara:strand:+ start:242 stop:406 length:165 start_codon:yes stop_codon:yes gene_type:complete